MILDFPANFKPVNMDFNEIKFFSKNAVALNRKEIGLNRGLAWSS